MLQPPSREALAPAAAAGQKQLASSSYVGRPWFWFVSAMLVAMVALLIGPRILDAQQVEYCVVNVHLPGPFGLSLNCDSPEFMRLAANPAALLEPRNTRQGRPGLILAAAAMALPLEPLHNLASYLGVRAQRGDIEPGRISGALAEDPPAFAAYIVLNVATLLLAFYYLQRLCNPSGSVAGTAATIAAVAIGLALIADDVVKVFLWSPHTQLFNILVPLLCVHAALRGWSRGLAERGYAIAIGLAVGFGFTAYPLFAVVLPSLFAPALLNAALQPSRLRAVLINSAIVIMLSIIPYAAWYLFVRSMTGGFYHHELALGEVTWIETAWSQGALVLFRALATNAWQLVELALPQALPAFAILAWASLAAASAKQLPALRATVPVVVAGLFVSALMIAFYAATGLIVARVAYAMVPPLVAIAGSAAIAGVRSLDERRRLTLALGCLAIALAQAAVFILKMPPNL
jgi:hypothetical protein